MSTMISVASGFQYSVNIGFDLYDDSKLKNFIPTESALELLEDILRSTDSSSTDRARVLIGAYGKGKSHIMLMILSMLMKRDLSLFEKTMPKIKENPELLHLVENYYESDNKILPIIITGSSTSLNQAFLLALQRTLSDNNLINAMPETNYQAAVNVIKKWEVEYPNTYKLFKDAVDEPIEVYIERLEDFDTSAYERFEKIYPTLTSGSIFNPFLDFDVIDLYESVAKNLKKSGYTGLYIVYDEFSKYLEANIKDASVSDIKMLQDFAEKCDRSGETQLHLMLISHKEISNYIDKLPKQKVDGWRGVSERFRHIHMSDNFSQTYEIISSVIQKKEPAWKEFLKNKDKDFDDLYQRYQKHPIFFELGNDISVIIKGCYPLHPVSTFILPRLSELVAQNERTLFTFLSSKGMYTLSEFLDKYDDREFKLITPDVIYDYFEPLFKREAYVSDIYTNYILTDVILNQLTDNSLEAQIVKTISLIYDIEQFEKLQPTIEEIIGIYSTSYTIEEIERAIDNLIENQLVIYLKRSNGYLRLKKTSGVDVKQKTKDYVESNFDNISTKEILNSTNFDAYMYPSRYNDEKEMVRYFSFEFIDSKEIDSETDWDIRNEAIKSDGIIYGILPSSEEDINVIRESIKISSKNKERCFFIIPRHYTEIDSIVREYQAVMILRDQAVDDPVLFDEYEVMFEDLYEVIRCFINKYTHPEEYAAMYIYDGEIIEIRRKAAMTELMSKICERVYSLTPVINNESINRNEITSTTFTSRNKIIGALLRPELEPNLGFVGSGQEVSIMRSTLIRTGILKEENKNLSIDLHPDNKLISNLLGIIENFIFQARQEGSINMEILYEQLISPKYHIGLRQGLIPIYLAVVLHNYREQIIITDNGEQLSLNVDALIQINANPEQFCLGYIDWNPEKEAYVNQLSDAFSDNIVDYEKTNNLYESVTNAIHRWYMALPKYSKECKIRPNGRKIGKRQLEMIRLIKQNIGGSELLFKKLPEVFHYNEEFTADAAEDIINTKNLFDGLLGELKDYLLEFVRDLFVGTNSYAHIHRITVTSAIKEWRESLDESVFEQLFANGTNKFLELIQDTTNDEDLFIIRAAKMATGLRLEDWDDDTHLLFEKTIKQYKITAERFQNNKVDSTSKGINSYQIMFTDEEGDTSIRRFDKVEMSARGKLLFNQINAAIDAMGQAISEQEKRQILMEVLKKLC